MQNKPPRFMESQLGLPLSEVLATMQARIMQRTHYFGIPTLKCPLDFWVYQELIHQIQPDYIIEIGNFHGGHLLALAHLCDARKHGEVIGCDVSHANVSDRVRKHPRITLVEGDAVMTFPQVAKWIGKKSNVLVIEDSAHTFDNTLAVLRTYSPLIKPGGYFIVEDSICHHGLDVGPRPGPYEAIEKFLAENAAFESDRSRESFLITWNPKGYLRRKA